MTDTAMLPELPEPEVRCGEYAGPAGEGASENLFTASQMRDYALASIRALGEQEAAPIEGGEGWELLAMAICEEEQGDPHQLIWDGYPPEPWGEAWQKYEHEAKRMIEMVRKHVSLSHHQPQEPVEALKKQNESPAAANVGGLDERKAFDKWHMRYGKGFTVYSEFNSVELAAAWKAWQARAELDGYATVAYGYIARANDGHETFFKGDPAASAFNDEKWRGLMEVIPVYRRAANGATAQQQGVNAASPSQSPELSDEEINALWIKTSHEAMAFVDKAMAERKLHKGHPEEHRLLFARSLLSSRSKDAERLDFLIAEECQVWEVNGRYSVRRVTEAEAVTAEFPTARAAIDSAIAAQGKGGAE